MRVTSSMYYESLYGANNSKLSKKLFDVNKQIASGLKIQYAKDDVRTFAETMRLDNELSTIGQIKKSTESGHKIANQTDVVLNEFNTTMTKMRTLLVQAANDAQSDTSLDAIAKELRIIEDHLKNLSNTSINGQYLFSGTAVDIKPISADGTYQGNSGSLNSFLGSNAQQKYNISGDELFLGEEVLTKRTITTNVMQSNLNQKYDFVNGEDNETLPTPLRASDTIRDMMGDTDNNVDTVTLKHHFYIRGTTSSGEAIKEHISMKDDDTIDELLKNIGEKFGNTPNLDVVNVSLNKNGQIVIEDKIKGSSKLDFHMVGAVDFTGGAAANVTDIDDLDVGENSFSKIMNGTSTALNPNLHVKEFVKSGYTSADGAATNIEGLVYDRTAFEKKGSSLTSNMPQIVKKYNASTDPHTQLVGNSFANPSTKISDVADLQKEILPATTPKTYTLDGTEFTLNGTNVAGNNFDIRVNFASAGSTFTVIDPAANAGTYDIFNTSSTPRVAVDADKMTYQQLMDVVNMAVTNSFPTNVSDENAYDSAIKGSKSQGNTYLTYDGKLKFEEVGAAHTKATISMYDSKSDDFTAAGSALSFNSNNALTIVDPKTDFFREVNEMITAVEDHKNYPDASSGSVRNIGVENAIAKMDALHDHITRSHSMVGSQSNALTLSKERVELLEISTMTLRSSVIDTDLAEAALTLTQLELNYQAMLSTIGKVSKLSLVNYL